jgi:hypothetical protein
MQLNTLDIHLQPQRVICIDPSECRQIYANLVIGWFSIIILIHSQQENPLCGAFVVIREFLQTEVTLAISSFLCNLLRCESTKARVG